MDMHEAKGYAMSVVLISLLFLLGYAVGTGVSTHSERANAIEAGVARYEVDPKTGVTTFAYVSQTKIGGKTP